LDFGQFGDLRDLALLWGLSATRVAVAFLLVPLFTTEVVPALVRNSIFASIALLGLALQPPPAPLQLTGWQWALQFGREAFIGAAIGFFFATTLWAYEAAGQLIDAKVGSNMAQITDPLSGHQTSLNGAFFARLAAWVFMSSGGFMLMIGVLMSSYAAWPVQSPGLTLSAGGVQLFESEFGRLMALVLLISAPALIVLYLIDAVLGLVNRFAQQLNVFSLSMSLKAVAATWIIWIQVSTMVLLLRDDLMDRPAKVMGALRALLGF